MALAVRKAVSTEGGRLVTAPVNPQESLDGIIQREPVVAPKPTRTAIVDSDYLPAQHIINQTEGTPTSVDYYHQILGVDDPAKPLQLGSVTANQKYHLIQQYLIRITSALTQEQDQETLAWSVTGSGTIQYGIVPNVGDMFIMDTAERCLGLLTLTSVKKLAYTKNAVYDVEFVLVDRLNVDVTENEFMQELAKRVVKRSVFDPTLLELLDNPIVSESDYEAFNSVIEAANTIKAGFINKFWVPSVQGYVVPTLNDITYDGWHSKFCRAIGFFDNRRQITLLQNGPLPYDNITTLYDLLTKRTTDFTEIKSQFGVVATKSLRKYPVLRGVGFSLYDYTVYPKDFTGSEEPTYGIYAVETPTTHAGEFDYTNAPLYTAVASNGFYVLSRAFYEGTELMMSTFENCVYKMVKGVAVDIEVVIELYKQYKYLRTYDQFYYGPILYCLLLNAKRNPVWK
jgi:hypothetical protein